MKKPIFSWSPKQASLTKCGFYRSNCGALSQLSPLCTSNSGPSSSVCPHPLHNSDPTTPTPRCLQIYSRSFLACLPPGVRQKQAPGKSVDTQVACVPKNAMHLGKPLVRFGPLPRDRTPRKSSSFWSFQPGLHTYCLRMRARRQRAHGVFSPFVQIYWPWYRQFLQSHRRFSMSFGCGRPRDELSH
jgi:hypothetical protein